ncbi:baseplate J/gp47 family protein [Saliphagus sp. LR7]|uniref:baseplate J/gp47 family protein n=1 Tax=Saliphagus sp. LR7 TaxID=2282654 RepID=UPI000DF7F604|nr:baseplate J/gp47 family protein [Saliphagus sp. LR7]
MSSNGTEQSTLAIRDLFREFGVTSSGFRRPPIDVIWETFVREWEDRSGMEITGVSSEELQRVEWGVLQFHTYFEQLEAVYYSSYFGTAVGEQLDQKLSEHGFNRIQRREATGEVTFYPSEEQASEDIDIDAGTRVATGAAGDGETIYFETTDPATIPAGGTMIERVPIRAVDPVTSTLNLTDEQTGSSTNVEAGAIDRVIDGVNGVDDVTNPLPTGSTGTRADDTTYSFVSGRDREVDHEFRRRYLNTLGIGGAATKDAIEAEILTAGDNETDVRDVSIEEDLPIREVTDPDTGETVYVGRQIEPVVAFDPLTESNPDASVISQAVLNKRACGIRSVGPSSGPAELDDSDGTEYATGLGWRSAEWVDIHVDVSLEVTREWTSRTEAIVKENIVEWIGGSIAGEWYDGQGLDEDVYYSRVLGAVLDHDIESWVDNLDVQIGTDPQYMDEATITMGFDQIPIVDPANIEINVTRRT